MGAISKRFILNLVHRISICKAILVEAYRRGDFECSADVVVIIVLEHRGCHVFVKGVIQIAYLTCFCYNRHIAHFYYLAELLPYFGILVFFHASFGHKKYALQQIHARKHIRFDGLRLRAVIGYCLQACIFKGPFTDGFQISRKLDVL